jgi:hypothetical protein
MSLIQIGLGSASPSQLQSAYTAMFDSYNQMMQFMSAMGNIDNEGNIQVPNGNGGTDTINIRSISGAQEFTIRFHFLSAQTETVSAVFNLLKSMDGKLGNMLT